MQYSSYYEILRKASEKDLIEDWDLATSLPESEQDIVSACCYYTAGVRLPVRDVIHEKRLDEKVKEYDVRLIKYVLKKGAEPAWERVLGEIEPPLKAWWWWLDKIAEGTYPSELLPEHLREVYDKENKA